MPDFDPYLAWLGIPPTQRPPNYYQLLGVDPAITDPAVVKTLAIQRIAFVRNFQRGEYGDVCAKILEELAKAEMTLTNPVSRADYDRSLRPVAPPPQGKPIAAKVLAVPATKALEPSPVRRPRRGKRRREAMEVVKWTMIGVAALAMIVVGVSIFRALRPSNDLANERPAERAAEKPAKPGIADAIPTVPKALTARFRATPNDADAVVESRNAKIRSEPPLQTIEFDHAALTLGIDVTFSKRGYRSKTVRVQRRDVDSSVPIEVALDAAERATATLVVVPESAKVTVENGEAAKGERGTWSITVHGETPKVSVEAPGFVSQTFAMVVGAGPLKVALKANASECWKHYAGLDADYSLRLVGRAGGFGNGARKVALSHNGKFLVVAEGGFPIRIHVWDVEKGEFAATAASYSGAVPRRGFGYEYAPPLSVAVTNDGRTVALAAFVLAIVDVAKGETSRSFGTFEELAPRHLEKGETRRTAAGDPASSKPTDVLSVSFSSDDSKLFATLRNGKVVVRETKNYVIKDTLSGFEPGSEDVRIDNAGENATANAIGGARLWQKDPGKMQAPRPRERSSPARSLVGSAGA